MSKISVGLVEDNSFLAKSIADNLSLSEDITLAFRVANGLELLNYVSINTVPDVILMDIEMGKMDGITATRAIKQLHPLVKVLILTVFDDDLKLFDAIKAGASGYLLKDEKPARLINAITEVLEGGAPMSPAMASKALDLLRNPPSSVKIVSETTELTNREKEILELLTQGLNVRQISERLFVADKTVRKHLEHIYQKLHVKGSLEAVAKVRRR